jgi:hypothetical protein
MKDDTSYSRSFSKKNRRISEKYSTMHLDPDVPLRDARGLHPLCKGCCHIVNSTECKYITRPKLRKFPCFFRETVT